MRRYLCFIISIGFFLCAGSALAQADTAAGDSATTSWVDISEVTLVKWLDTRSCDIAFVHRGTLLTNSSAIPFKKGFKQASLVRVKDVTKTMLLRFHVFNSADSGIAAWFFPGTYFRDIVFYRQDGDRLHKIQAIRPPHADSISYRQLYIGAHDSATIVAALTPIRTYLNRASPRLVNNAYLPSFIKAFHENSSPSNLVTYLFCGLFLMMILYSLSNYFQNRNRESLYYSGYAFFVGLMLSIKAASTFHTTELAFFQEEYLDFILQSTGHLCYMLFMSHFLNTKTNHPFLYKLYNTGIVTLVIAMAGYSGLHFFTDNFSLENRLENLTKIILLVMVVIFIIYSISHWKDKLLRYLFWGNLCLFIFALVSLTIVMTDNLSKNFPEIFRSSLFYYECGLFFELVFFLAGLNYKNHRQLVSDTKERERLKAKDQMNEYEKKLAVLKAQQEERERISADMHDELGSGMTAIRLMSEIARNKMKKDTPVEIEKISSSADEVLNKMNAIIWSMDSEHDSLDNLVSYIRAYALEYFESTPILCKVNTPARIADKNINGDKRRNIFLCVKETLTNALKHSKAEEITIDFETSDSLLIRITDNGVGIDKNKLRQFGNGLKNIAKRMESIGGTFHIENNNGTMTTLILPL